MQESTTYLRRNEAIKLLENANCSSGVIRHCIAVSKNAREIAEKLKKNGYDIDVNFVEIAALLHDIGRSNTHGIFHGVEGAKILKGYGLEEKFIRICERHIGAGLTKDDALSLGLPAGNYLPETLEEKIIAHADNITSKDKIVDISVTIRDFEKKLGKGHPAINRLKELNDFIEGLIRKNK